MDERVLQRQFAKIGARIKINVVPPSDRRFRRRRNSANGFLSFLIDVRQDRRGEIFTLDVWENPGEDLEFIAVNVRPELKHLLLLARGPGVGSASGKQKYLCGHDERHWFVAAVPEVRGVATVRSAMDALKPQAVLDSQRAHRVKSKNWNRRRNVGYVRQGEWFFVPRPGFQPEGDWLVLRNEPIRRSGSTPHIVETLYRIGGTTVYVSSEYPNGLTEEEYRQLIQRDPTAQKMNWSIMQRNAEVYAMGKVSHPDHKTVVLPFWHRVLMSVERAGRNVANVVFLD